MDARTDRPESATQAAPNVHPLPVTNTSPDPYVWQHVHAEYRTGVTYSKLSEKYGIPVSSINARRKAEGWKRDLRKDVQVEVANRLVADSEPEISLGEVSDDRLIDVAAIEAVRIVRRQRRALGDAMEALSLMASRLRAAAEVRRVPTESTLGDLAEIASRIGTALDRIVKLERTSYGLDEQQEEKSYEERVREWYEERAREAASRKAA